MVSKRIIILLVIAMLLFAVSLTLSIFNKIPISNNQNEMLGKPQGSLNLVIYPTAEINEENQNDK